MRKFVVSLLLFIFAFLFFSTSNVSAKVITDEKGTVSVAKTEIVNDDLFIGAQTVDIAGTVNGDVFIGAQLVKITGVINGNLHVGANTIDLTGTVKGNVYAGGQNVLVSGSTIGGSLLVGAATFNIDKSSVVGGSVLVGAGAISIDSQVKRSVYAGAGSLTIGDGAIIGKDLYYGSGNNQANISTNAKIAGSTYKSEVDTGEKDIEAFRKEAPALMRGFRLGGTVISFIGALIVGFLYLKFFPKGFTGSAKLVSEAFWKSLGVGFLITICTIPALLLLAITVVGLPVAGIAIVVLTLYSYLAKIVVGSALGGWISRKMKWKASAYGAFALGLLVFYILKFIPYVGGLAGLVVLWSGLGALTLRMLQKAE
jgi:hypothetical protein